MRYTSITTTFGPLALSTLTALTARAEPPMTVDDAGTLARGGMKIEASLNREHETQGVGFVFGFAPLDHLEIGFTGARAHDREPSPAARLSGAGVSMKWVPMQADTGWSLGLSLAFDRTRVNDRATPNHHTAREATLTGLASHRWAGGQVVHLNLGARRTRGQGGTDDAMRWGIGYEQPLNAELKLTAEVFGESAGASSKALGVRYTVAEGYKVSAALGRGGGRGFGQIGFAWEF